MKQAIKCEVITTIDCILLLILSGFLADFIPDGKLDIAQHLLELIFNTYHHHNAITCYLMLSHVKVILFYSLLSSSNYIDITLFLHLLVLLVLIVLFFIKNKTISTTKFTFIHRLVSYHKLKQDIIKAFESIP